MARLDSRGVRRTLTNQGAALQPVFQSPESQLEFASDRYRPAEDVNMPVSMDIEVPRPPYHSGSNDAWIVTRYEDVAAVLRSPLVAVPSGFDDVITRVSRRLGGRYMDLASLIGALPLFQNGEDHRQSRSFLRDIIQATLARRGEDSAEAVVESHIRRLPINTDFDAMRHLCFDLPDALVGGAVGFTAEETRWLRQLGHRVVEGWRPAMSLRDYDEREAAAATLRQTFAEAWNDQGCPVLGQQRRAGRTRAPVPDRLRDGAVLLLFAVANETQAGFMGNVLHLLADRPDLQDALRREPSSFNAFIEESLRYCGSVRQRTRIAAGGALHLGGAVIPQGAVVHVKLESANRDLDAYPQPDVFLIDRKGPPVLSFGAGAHLCLGAPLARMLTARLLRAVLRRFAIFPGAAPPTIASHLEMRQFGALPLRLQPV